MQLLIDLQVIGIMRKNVEPFTMKFMLKVNQIGLFESA